MKIQLQSLFGLDVIKAFGGDEVEIGEEKVTLKTLLHELDRLSGGIIKLVDAETGEIAGEYFILVNGNNSKSLLHGLDTELNDDDEIGIGPYDILFSGG
ncbi:MAG: MoaD/ThiS family protein [Chloroflexi bacterium]|nr:MoaD/ThiS family protein [Chloroflexota bacterium]